MPSHPVALALIEAAKMPIAAPSANRFAQLSPTTAEHVRQALGDRVDYILDGGACAVGIESTVLSLAGEGPILLRPGGISRAQIEAVVGPVSQLLDTTAEAHPAPGMHPRHYSPRTRLILVRNGAVPEQGSGAYLQLHISPSRGVRTLVLMPANPAEYAANLYRVLHDLDSKNYDWIAVDTPHNDPEWDAIRDRLTRAATSEAKVPY